MRLPRPGVFLALLIGLALVGCVVPPATTPDMTPSATGASGETPVVVAFDELVANAGSYAGQQVCTEGIAVEGFEANALGAGTRQQGQAVYLTEPTIWIAGAQKEITGECSGPAGGGDIQFCPGRVCGLFQAAGGYGHLGQYAYEIR